MRIAGVLGRRGIALLRPGSRNCTGTTSAEGSGTSPSAASNNNNSTNGSRSWHRTLLGWILAGAGGYAAGWMYQVLQQPTEQKKIQEKPLHAGDAVDYYDLDPQSVVTEKVYFDIALPVHDYSANAASSPCSSSPSSSSAGAVGFGSSSSEDGEKQKTRVLTGRVILGLYGQDHPQLVRQFADLCDGQPLASATTDCQDKDKFVQGEGSGARISYANARFASVHPGQYCTGNAVVGAGRGISSAAAGESGPASATAAKSVAARSGPPRTTRHHKFGVLSTPCPIPADQDGAAARPCSDFTITFADCSRVLDGREPPHRVIGQVMYNGNEVLQHLEFSSVGRTGTEPPSCTDRAATIVASGRLPDMSAALEVDPHEQLDEQGKNRNRAIY